MNHIHKKIGNSCIDMTKKKWYNHFNLKQVEMIVYFFKEWEK